MGPLWIALLIAGVRMPVFRVQREPDARSRSTSRVNRTRLVRRTYAATIVEVSSRLTDADGVSSHIFRRAAYHPFSEYPSRSTQSRLSFIDSNWEAIGRSMAAIFVALVRLEPESRSRKTDYAHTVSDPRGQPVLRPTAARTCSILHGSCLGIDLVSRL
jgi:hypothetical protein